MFTLRFDPKALEFWASRFPDSPRTLHIMNVIAPRTRERGAMSREDFLAVCEWHSVRPRKMFRSNAPDFIREVTRASFTTTHERVRVQVLTLLHGVSLGTASVLLHFCSPDPYPILDPLSLWSLQAEPPQKFDFEFWWAYVQATRKLAKQAKIDMRTLDRALWQFAHENHN